MSAIKTVNVSGGKLVIFDDKGVDITAKIVGDNIAKHEYNAIAILLTAIIGDPYTCESAEYAQGFEVHLHNLRYMVSFDVSFDATGRMQIEKVRS